jgi:glycosyltransferase involved in cell wall biosynthesis
MPVRNGAGFVATAIRSLQLQSYRNWHLLISDNASTDDTAVICREFVLQDKRISLVTQKLDIGVAENFRVVLNDAREEFFMWASADDVWHPQFIDACVSALIALPERGMAFTGIENIDSDGRALRQYPQLASLSGAASYRTICRFLLQPEILGKANLIYSMYRTSLCRDAMPRVGFLDCWGSDMAFVLGAISRAGICIEPRVLFQKRIDASRETVMESEGTRKFLPGSGTFPLDAYPAYRTALLRAVRGTKFEVTTEAVMGYRYLRAILATQLEALREWGQTRIG